MIETDWGKPLHIAVTPQGDIQKFTTIEQARYWLRKRWPVEDEARTTALTRIEAAMACIGSVGSARRAFLAAASSAGFRTETRVA
ncbi:DUF982 domain-containing protein [Pseudomonas sp. GX19020]|uniref:DUF982 domain-containing protein n=1 Tax=Pseudomonadota TaxID=1224 RepID=UPI00089C8C39|nr:MULTISPECIES: DUF982 domain-containing protein [Pseudomonadota]MCL4068622.1 DUF982 domain-containing protein [Pseudomonas sp. GX19020]SEC14939.1 Protein of unknown function [Rhodobacter sp. 24-YEA-8]